MESGGDQTVALLDLSGGDRDEEDQEVIGLAKWSWIESKKLWQIVGLAIFSKVSLYSINIIMHAFVGHLGDLELASPSPSLATSATSSSPPSPSPQGILATEAQAEEALRSLHLPPPVHHPSFAVCHPLSVSSSPANCSIHPLGPPPPSLVFSSTFVFFLC
ncbi:protein DETOXIFICATION 21-like [Zingiber officinale]|uniref:protein DETOXIFICATION 21-like n=1 Tax=Zingiber officinale TaxID=94328 RepID=UPI001C4A7C75|nr:protein DETOXIFICATION 21-like [Zingiber officinale]